MQLALTASDLAVEMDCVHRLESAVVVLECCGSHRRREISGVIEARLSLGALDFASRHHLVWYGHDLLEDVVLFEGLLQLSRHFVLWEEACLALFGLDYSQSGRYDGLALFRLLQYQVLESCGLQLSQVNVLVLGAGASVQVVFLAGFRL